jgi:hypothetical protein
MKGSPIPLIIFCLILQYSISQPDLSSRLDQDGTDNFRNSETTIELVPRD